jgi:hypothetical protein
MTKMRLVSLTMAITASAIMITRAVVPLVAQETPAALLTQVRTALGGEAAVAAVNAISIDGPSRRMAGTRELDSYVSLLLVRPDKMRRSEETRFFNTNEITTTFDGKDVWQETVSRSGVGGGHSGPEHGGGGAGGHGDWDNGGQHDHGSADSANNDPADASLTPDQLAAARARRSRMELQRWGIVFLADSTRSFTNAGKAQSPDGPADVLETTDEAGRPIRYFIDAVTHLPLMLQYQLVKAATGLATVTMHLAEFKVIDGVKMPHRIDVAIDGQASESWTIDTVKLNPKVKAGTFQKPTRK